MLNASFAINYAVGGTNVRSYHIFNIGLHILNACILFGLLQKILRLQQLQGVFAGLETWLAGLITLTWAVHPLQTESVTYIVQRAEALVSLFYLLTFYCFISSINSTREQMWLFGSVLSCAAGMASKEVMATAPIALIGFDAVFVAGSFQLTWRVRRCFYIAMFSTWTILVGCVLNSGLRGGTVGAGPDTAWKYLLTQVEMIPRYFYLTIWPNELVFDYGKNLVSGIAEVWRGLMLLTILVPTIIWTWAKQPKLGWVACMPFVLLAPSSSIVPVVSQTAAEHRMYLALAPVVVLAFLLLFQILRARAFWAGLAIVGTLSALTVQRNGDYQTAESLWKDTVEKRPNNARAWLSLALTYLEGDHFIDAKAALEHAMQLEPNSVIIGADYAQVLAKLGEYERAEEMYRWALREKPDDYATCFNFGTMLLELNRNREAEEWLKRSLADSKLAAKAHYNLGNCQIALEKTDDAMTNFRRAIALNPGFCDARSNLASALTKVGKAREALDEIGAAIQAGCDTPTLRRNRALALIATGNVMEAVGILQHLVEKDTADASLYADLGLALASFGKAEDAIARYQTAIDKGYGRTIPAQARAIRVSLASLLQSVGKYNEAAQMYLQTLELDPTNVELEYLAGRALLLAGRYAEASSRLEAVVARTNSTAEMLNDLGVSYSGQRRTEEAKGLFERALKINPYYTEARENLASLQSGQ
ncbi:MAG: tetratricopeptide repeat protein [Nibricoccus sp.]